MIHLTPSPAPVRSLRTALQAPLAGPSDAPRSASSVAATPQILARLPVLVIMGAAALVLALVGAAAPAAATVTAELGEARVTVTPTQGLPAEGAVVTVEGTGFDVSKGIYVAACRDNGPGARPTPCVGGVDTGGEGGASAWFSDNPPSYGTGLAEPFGPGGSFSVTLSVPGTDPVTGVNCVDGGCVVAVTYDHTRIQDRSGDVLVPLTFGGSAEQPPADPEPSATEEPTPEPTTPAPTATDDAAAAPDDAQDAAGGGDGARGITTAVALAVVVVAVAAGAVLVRRRAAGSTPPDDGPSGTGPGAGPPSSP